MNNLEIMTIEGDVKKDELATLFIGLFGLGMTLAGLFLTTPPILLWIGMLFLGGWVYSVISNFKQTITINPNSKNIKITKQTRFTNNDTIIPFDHIQSIEIIEYEMYSEDEPSPTAFHLQLRTKDNTTYLMHKASKNAADLKPTADKIAQQIGCPSKTERSTPPKDLNIQHMIIAGISAVVIYILWYRLFTGQICPAMWAGSAPPIIILVVFIIVLRLLRIFIK